MESLKILHIDMNYNTLKPETIRRMVDYAADSGFNAILWELENKVQWTTCPAAIDPEAMTKEEFREILAYSRSRGLEPIPLLQCIGHGEYVLKHPEYAHMRELPDHPDCYCVMKKEVRAFVSSLIEEYVELFGELKYFHLGGDEAYVFGRCPECSKQEKNALYGEYIRFLAEKHFLPRNIRPGIWHDMIYAHPETVKEISSDFMIWFWGYGIGNGVETEDTALFEGVDFFRENGYDVVVCPAVRSAGDSPFYVRWQHAGNVMNAVRKAQRDSLAGVCVTNWAIRLGCFDMTLPLLEVAPRLWRDPAGDASAILRGIREEYYGIADADLLQKVLFWPNGYMILTSVQWNGWKDGTFPPEGFFRDKRQWILDKADGGDAMKYLPQWAEDLRKNEAEYAGMIQPDTPFRETLCAMLSLRNRFVYTLYEGCFGESPDFAKLAVGLEEIRKECEALYLRDQMPASAAHNAELLVQPLKEYCASHLPQC